MITSPQDYYDHLWQIQNFNQPTLAVLLPKDEKIYEIDLNSRTVETPEFLSVETDHRAEIIYFVVDRFYDHFDLTNANCIIQYINKTSGRAGLYAVPFYDIHTKSTPEKAKILFPWSIGGIATEAAGDVEYSICFYTLGPDKTINYNLNTIPCTSKVLHGMTIDLDEYKAPIADGYEELLALINSVQEQSELYWYVIE